MAQGDERRTTAGYLGRGRGHLIFYANCVLKTSPRKEPLFMNEFPSVFVPVSEIGDGDPTKFRMPLYEPSHPDQIEKALLSGLQKLKLLWAVPRFHPKLDWRKKLHEHLLRQNELHNLGIAPRYIGALVQSLPMSNEQCLIHGDSTLANLVYGQNDWWWIDPLDRDYIPGDPYVDLGKMYQSCWNYESILLGSSSTKFNMPLAMKLIKEAGLDIQGVYGWCLVHLIRLLPYQDQRVRYIYGNMIRGFDAR
jgi:hypothetical protein